MPKDNVNGNSNLTAVKKVVREVVDIINEAKNDRAEANADIAAARARAEANGIPKKALAWAMQYMELSPEDREGHDLAYEIVREELGAPVSAQGELFTKEQRDEMKAARKEQEKDDAEG